MPDWFLDWRGRCCVIIASGPTAATADLSVARGCPTIAINSSWALAPWADVLYGADDRWWVAAQGAPDFAGLKVTVDKLAAERYGLKLLRYKRGCHTFTLDEPGVIGVGGHSGFHAINLAAQFGARKIVLVGYDLRIDRGVHWHPDHRTMNPDINNIQRWADRLDEAAPVLAGLGIEVINTSEASVLRMYPKMSLADAIREL